jgi:hypothetical protein
MNEDLESVLLERFSRKDQLPCHAMPYHTIPYKAKANSSAALLKIPEYPVLQCAKNRFYCFIQREGINMHKESNDNTAFRTGPYIWVIPLFNFMHCRYAE